MNININSDKPMHPLEFDTLELGVIRVIRQMTDGVGINEGSAHTDAVASLIDRGFMVFVRGAENSNGVFYKIYAPTLEGIAFYNFVRNIVRQNEAV